MRPSARVIGVDRDTEALRLAGERLAPFGERFTGVHAVYDEIPDVLADLDDEVMTRIDEIFG